MPKHFNHRSPGRPPGSRRRGQRHRPGPARRPPGRPLPAGAPGEDPEITQLRTELRQHPCHACPEREEHARWAERRHRLERDTEALREQGRRPYRFAGPHLRPDRARCSTDRGYLSADGEVTDAGRMLGRIWTEADLLVAECLRRGVWDGLAPAELAAAVSMVLYESRREGDERAVGAARARSPTRSTPTLKLWAEIEADEAERGPDADPRARPRASPGRSTGGPGARPLAKVLASGHRSTARCRPATSSGGPGRCSTCSASSPTPAAPPTELRATARQAITAVNRGVLAYHTSA